MTKDNEIPDLPALSEVADEDAPPPRAYVKDRDRQFYHPSANGQSPEALPTVGEETLMDLPFGATPPQLVPPFLTPEGATIFFGPGGVGKGLLAVYFARELVRANRRVTIIDFEYHPREWGRRSHRMGFEDAELAMVNYRAPFGHSWTAATGSLVEIAPRLVDDLDNPERHVDYLIIDSFTMATSTGEALGGMPAAQEFFSGLARLRRPAMVIAHVAGGQDKWPDKPFGSVFVHNLARETWAVERTSGEDSIENIDPDSDPSPMVLELRNKKSNGASREKPQFFTFTFESEAITVDRTPPYRKTWADLAGEILARGGKMSTKELSSVFKAEEGVTANSEALRKTLARHPGRFRKTTDTPYRWEVVSG